jgi:hypothetical protein
LYDLGAVSWFSAAGEEIIEPEVDLSGFLERQRLEGASEPVFVPNPDDDEDVDHSLAHISSKARSEAASRKGKVQQIEWDAALEELSREKAIAEAHRGTWPILWPLLIFIQTQAYRSEGAI